jgi:chaperonin GroES
MLKPLDARVVVSKPPKEEMSSGGIILPDTVNEQGQTAVGKVEQVGPGSRNMNDGQPMPMDVKVGDKIVYMKFSAIEIEDSGVEYFVVSERDIVAIVEN